MGFVGSLFGRGIRAASTTFKDKQEAFEGSGELPNISGDENEAPFPPLQAKRSSLAKHSNSGDAVLNLVAIQLFDGSWDCRSPDFIELIAAAADMSANSEDKKRCAEFCAAESARSGTALAIAALRVGQSARSEEWAMIVEKAIDWLEEELGSATAVTELIAKAEKALSK